MNPQKITIALLVVFTLVVCLQLRAADEEPAAATGTIIGTVLDAGGNPAADVIVVAQQSAQKMREGIQGTTGTDGTFKLENVPEGDYNLKFRTRDGRRKALKSASVIASKTTDVGKIKLKST